MKSVKVFLTLISICFLSCDIEVKAAKKVPERTSLELQAIQAQTFDTNKSIAFGAVVSVFQDFGYIVESADLSTGFITASSPLEQTRALFRPLTQARTKVTAFIEDFPNKKVKIRINFVNHQEKQYSSQYGSWTSRKDNAVQDPLTYQNAFAKIQEAIFIRTPLSTEK